MTAHPIDTEALKGRMRRAVAIAEADGCGAYIDPRYLTALLDLLAAAEHRADEAEARVKAVEDVLDHHGVGDPDEILEEIERALTA